MFDVAALKELGVVDDGLNRNDPLEVIDCAELCEAAMAVEAVAEVNEDVALVGVGLRDRFRALKAVADADDIEALENDPLPGCVAVDDGTSDGTELGEDEKAAKAVVDIERVESLDSGALKDIAGEVEVGKVDESDAVEVANKTVLVDTAELVNGVVLVAVELGGLTGETAALPDVVVEAAALIDCETVNDSG